MKVEGPSSQLPSAPPLASPSSEDAVFHEPVLTPISQLIFFHKAIRAELEQFHRSAVALTRGTGDEALAFLRRYKFIRAVYKYHSWAEDEVLFPALDARVKNVANAYTLEHEIEGSLFDQLSAMLARLDQHGDSLDRDFQRELACCSEALSTVLAQHLAKEEEHVFPLLCQHFSSREQGRLMWDFLTSLPVKLMAECLPWVASHLSESEQKEMANLMRLIVPRENLVQQLVSGWMRQVPKLEPLLDWTASDVDDTSPFPWGSPVPRLPSSTVAHHRATISVPAPPRATPHSDLKQCPIDEVVRWHDAMRRELSEFHEELSELEKAEGDDVQLLLSSFQERLRFLTSICQFHSIAEDEVVFPALLHSGGDATQSLSRAHREDQERFSALGELFTKVSDLQRHSPLACGAHPSGEQQQLLLQKELRQAAAALVVSVLEHLEAEEEQVLPLLRTQCSPAEQRSLVFQSLLVMPLNLLEVVLPWLHRHLAVEEARQAIQNMQMAAPAVDGALVELLTQWCSEAAVAKPLARPAPQGTSGEEGAALQLQAQEGRTGGHPDGTPGESQAGSRSRGSRKAGARSGEEAQPQRKKVRMLRGLSLTCRAEDPSSPGASAGPRSLNSAGDPGSPRASAGAPGDATANGAVGDEADGTGEHSAHSGLRGEGSFGKERASSGAASMDLFWEGSAEGTEQSEGPIDAIFSFHQALRKELDHLCSASRRLGECAPESLRAFSGRFHFMWGLYRAHSNAEDSIVFPALEAKEALHNVSHSYSIDHKQEEELFSDIALLLGQLGDVAAALARIKAGSEAERDCGAEQRHETTASSDARGDFLGGNHAVSLSPLMGLVDAGRVPSSGKGVIELSTTPSRDAGIMVGGARAVPDGAPDSTAGLEALEVQWRELGSRLARMCLSVRLALDQHVSREEAELWPLFRIHFSTEEQDRIVGRIIGTTGAEVLQAMLTWITAALSEKEQQATMGAWKQATRNTMFEEWLSNWWGEWGGAPLPVANGALEGNGGAETAQAVEEEDPLQAVAEYFGAQGLPGVEGESGNGVGEVQETRLEAALETEPGTDAEYQTARGCGAEGVASGSGTSDQQHGQVRGPDTTVAGGEKAFKSGWHNIFRVNQTQLEAAIRKVSQDTSLDPRRKAYLMQNLMTSRWIVAQQRGSAGSQETAVPSEADRCPTFADEAAGVLGCEHYQRNCKLKAACCGRLFPCRFCHDKESDHAMERRDTTEMMCMRCLEMQPIAQKCATPSCQGLSMAKYFCGICKLLDNSRDIYHCPFCNLCRVGRGLGVDYFHCMKCNSCMSISLSEHKCREKGLESNCPICHDFLFTSSTPVRALPCGHFMHSSCFQAYTFEHYTCPICLKSVGDMSVYFGMLDALLASEQLPEELSDKQQGILCNDCGQRGQANFHWLYHKCSSCGSYNTKTL